MTSTTQTATAQETKPATEALAHEQEIIDDAVGRIEYHLAGVVRALLDIIIRWLRIGAELNDLHSQVSHGKWEATVEEKLGLNKTTVQRYRKLADSNMEQQILTLGPDLRAHLPNDVQKLVMLLDVPEGQFKEFMQQHNPATLSRSKLRKAIKAFNGEEPVKTDTASQNDADDEASTSKTTTESKTKSESEPSDAESDQPDRTCFDQLIEACERISSELAQDILQRLADGTSPSRLLLERANTAVGDALDSLEQIQMGLKEQLASQDDTD